LPIERLGGGEERRDRVAVAIGLADELAHHLEGVALAAVFGGGGDAGDATHTDALAAEELRHRHFGEARSGRGGIVAENADVLGAEFADPFLAVGHAAGEREVDEPGNAGDLGIGEDVPVVGGS
jgi:phage-related minor tail protein